MLEGLTPAERRHLERARQLAREGWGRVAPNPMVGCVIARDEQVIGEGFHREFGAAHAEVAALRVAGDARGATAIVSLEPCAHHGKTPPCTDALVDAGITRVVFGASDPHDAAAGGGEALRKAGLDVIGPIWSPAEAVAENPVFHHRAAKNTPYVALKMAVSLDGKIARAPGVRTQLTGPEATREVHRLRSGHDAVMVGAGTLRADDPRLTVRLAGPGRGTLHRIVLSTGAEVDPGMALLHDVDVSPVHVFCGHGVSGGDEERLRGLGVGVRRVQAGAAGLYLPEILDECSEMGIESILCEGGARLATSLLEADLVQRLYVFLAPVVLGPAGVPVFMTEVENMLGSWRPVVPGERFGSDSLIILDRVTAGG